MMCANTGKWLTLEQHVYQSIEKCIFTLLGTRLRRRAFGSIVPELLDHAPTPFNLSLLQAGLVLAVMNFEKRFRFTRVVLTPSTGQLDIDIAGLINDQPVQYHYRYYSMGADNG